MSEPDVLTRIGLHTRNRLNAGARRGLRAARLRFTRERRGFAAALRGRALRVIAGSSRLAVPGFCARSFSPAPEAARLAGRYSTTGGCRLGLDRETLSPERRNFGSRALIPAPCC